LLFCLTRLLASVALLAISALDDDRYQANHDNLRLWLGFGLQSALIIPIFLFDYNDLKNKVAQQEKSRHPPFCLDYTIYSISVPFPADSILAVSVNKLF
jgi:hypothetical protein